MKKTLMNCSGYYRSDMKGYDRLLVPITDEIVDETLLINNELFLARPMNEKSTLSVSGNNINNDEVIINNAVLLASNDNLNVKFINQWTVEKFPLSQISTLFCFLDYQTKNCESNIRRINSAHDESRPAGKEAIENERSIVLLLENNHDRLMDVLISGILDPQKQFLQNIFTFIRNMESYWIAYFLLSQVFSDDNDSDAYKLYNACKTYGVSESYFRKLCHNAFTCGPKKQLRMWRAAYSALQLIEKDKSIATIAGNNGYSSSSHFSSEIKSIFGITPREFKKLEGLLHE
ncbi:helix-turn-helix domain-containing protein [Klebsiella sp. BIGb0407]|uniref:helix-turn-helix domain-containing protein n=1 Tax=Klebsiella sp. BIGb0407 TaxID=2940603 RepID=UPI0021694017|nr:helix-turn-helix domain-containing protein [Klebsiella sp. BIGb0407]MCS3431551.1 AraC-like DNA-binding protein [Klebsiella sp. BIGb0407]